MFNFIRQGFIHNLSIRSLSSGLSFTPRCIEKLSKLTSDVDGNLRILVEGGGCSGFQYVYKLDKSINADDQVIKQNGVSVVVDSVSFDFIKDSVLDYQDELIRSGFQIIKNPQAEKGCSCGVSFAARLD